MGARETGVGGGETRIGGVGTRLFAGSMAVDSGWTGIGRGETRLGREEFGSQERRILNQELRKHSRAGVGRQETDAGNPVVGDGLNNLNLEARKPGFE